MVNAAVAPNQCPLPKFVIHGRTLSHDLRKQRGTGKCMVLVPLFDLKFLNELGKRCRNFKSAALAATEAGECGGSGAPFLPARRERT
jgi:hypothetical protein